jgi:hypothetical protein
LSLILNLRVANKVVNKPNSYTLTGKLYEIKPFKITRQSCGSQGQAANRYYYQAHFIGFDDMLDIHKNSLVGQESTENIVRAQNPRFNPKSLTWDKNTALIN